jgi:hypothetical protein
VAAAAQNFANRRIVNADFGILYYGRIGAMTQIFDSSLLDSSIRPAVL